MEPNHIHTNRTQTQGSQTKEFSPDYIFPTDMTFDGPVKTLDQLRLALIQKMGPEKGQQMYDKFVQSLLISTFGNIHKDMDRAQKASKKMRSIYKD